MRSTATCRDDSGLVAAWLITSALGCMLQCVHAARVMLLTLSAGFVWHGAF